jgi:hypothetical protein
VIEESKIMKEIHKIRSDFYRKTKGRSPAYILKIIKEESLKVKQELEGTKPDPRLITEKRYPIPEPISMREIHQIREKGGDYGG